jgi:hypothetical protein
MVRELHLTRVLPTSLRLKAGAGLQMRGLEKVGAAQEYLRKHQAVLGSEGADGGLR